MRLLREREAILRGQTVPDGSPSSVVIAYLCAGFDLLRDGYLRTNERGPAEVTDSGRAALFRRLSLAWFRLAPKENL